MKAIPTILISVVLIAAGCSRGGQPAESRDVATALADEAPDVTVRVEEVDPPQPEHQAATANTDVPAPDKLDTDAKIKTGDDTDSNSDAPSTTPPNATGQDSPGQDGTTTPPNGEVVAPTPQKSPATAHHRRRRHSTPSYDKGLQDLLKDKKPKDTGDTGGGASTTGSTTDSTTGGTTGGGTSTDGGATTGDTGA